MRKNSKVYNSKEEKITMLKSKINFIIKELAKLQEDIKDEETLVRLSDLTQQRDRLSSRLEELESLDTDVAKDNKKIDVGHSVVLKLGRRKIKVNIVDDFAVNSSSGNISLSSPLGSVLQNKKSGETVSVKTPSGVKEYEIVQFS